MLSFEDDKDDSPQLPEELREFYEDKKHKLGSGAFSKVLLAEHKGTKELVAVKVMSKEKLKRNNNMHRVYLEVEALKNLVHENICQLYQVYESEDYVSLVLEHCSGGELFDYIVLRKRIQENEARRLFRQMISAFSFIHENGYAHRDIKPENMLLSYDKEIKIIDFGLSVKPANGLSVPLVTRVGSPAYAAPELVSGEIYFGNETDVWSLGVVLYAVLCGFLPFDEETTDKLYESIKRDSYPASKHLSKGSEKLISSMLEKDPKKRITMRKLLEHEWVMKNNEYPPVTLPSTSNIFTFDFEIIDEVAAALGVTVEFVEESITQMRYDDAMAYYLLMSKRKKRDIRKFSLIYGISERDSEQIHRQNNSSRFRPRSQTEKKDRRKMPGNIAEEDKGASFSMEANKGESIHTYKSLPHGATPADLENEMLMPLLSSDEKNKPCNNSVATQNVTEVKCSSNSVRDAKPRSASRLNELVSIIFKYGEKPRKVKGFYHMENTSTKCADDIRKELIRVLNELCCFNVIDNYSNSKRFLFRCKALDRNRKKMIFELEICTIPKIEHVLGIRNKRVSGNAWFYKEMVERIFSLVIL